MEAKNSLTAGIMVGKPDYAIGIDTGKNTGYAVWDCREKQFLRVDTLRIHEAMFCVKERIVTWKAMGAKFIIRVEDARKRKWIQDERDSEGKVRNRQQGAGSIKRDATMWDDFLHDENVNYEMVAPKRNTTKLSATTFRSLTKYEGRTSEHGRDAAMLVFGY